MMVFCNINISYVVIIFGGNSGIYELFVSSKDMENVFFGFWKKFYINFISDIFFIKIL